MLVDLATQDVDVDGVWAMYREGVRFLIARAGNPKYLKAQDKAEAPFRRQRSRGKAVSIDDEINIQCKAMAEGILRGWEGINTDEGPLEYSPENAFKVLRFNAEIRDFVFEFATERSNYRTEDIEGTAKKS